MEHAIELPALLMRAGVPVAAALAGGVAGAMGGPRERLSGALVSFAAGAFLGIALVHLLPDAMQEAGGIAWIAALAGAGAAALSRRASVSCPTCVHGEGVEMHVQLGPPLFAILAIHSFLDGFALGGAGGHSHSSETLSLALLIHKLPEGMAIAAISRAAGHSLGRALLLTLAIQSFTFVGVSVALAVGHGSGLILGLAMGAVAGSFLYLVAFTLGRIRSAARPAVGGGLALAGMLLVLLARFSFG